MQTNTTLNTSGIADVAAGPASQNIRGAVAQFLPQLRQAKSRAASETDTAFLLKQLFKDVLGWNEDDVTSEYRMQSAVTDSAIEVDGKLELVKSTLCDIALKADGKPRMFVEVRAIGHKLMDKHAKPALNYAATVGVPYVLLTNAELFRLFRTSTPDSPSCEINLFDTLTDRDCENLAQITRTSLQHANFEPVRTSTITNTILQQALMSDEVVAAIGKFAQAKYDLAIEPKAIKDRLAKLSL